MDRATWDTGFAEVVPIDGKPVVKPSVPYARIHTIAARRAARYLRQRAGGERFSTWPWSAVPVARPPGAPSRFGAIMYRVSAMLLPAVCLETLRRQLPVLLCVDADHVLKCSGPVQIYVPKIPGVSGVPEGVRALRNRLHSGDLLTVHCTINLDLCSAGHE